MVTVTQCEESLKGVWRFSWQLESEAYDVIQQGYQLQVGFLGGEEIVYDSGPVYSNQSLYVKVNELHLDHGRSYEVKVRVLIKGHWMSWSKGRRIESHKQFNKWQIPWISHPYKEKKNEQKPVYYYKKEFEMSKDIIQGKLYVTALGLYDIKINKQTWSKDLFRPGFTNYRNRLFYQEYDITTMLHQGINHVSVAVGDGWYRGVFTFLNKRNLWGRRTGLSLMMELTDSSGNIKRMTTDETWAVSCCGPIQQSEFYWGECYDQRLDIDTLDYHPAIQIKAPKMEILPQQGPSVQGQERLIGKEIRPSVKGGYIVDFGQNAAGRLRAVFRNTLPGQKIIITHGEILDGEGEVYTKNLRQAQGQLTYYCKGGEVECYTPTFTYMGFRYIWIQGYEEVVESTLQMEVVSSTLKRTGVFTCGSPKIQRLYENIIWGQRSNFVEIPTDCPQRDERMGYTGDAQIFIATAAYNADIKTFMLKWLDDLRSEQGKNGIVDMTIPREIRIPGFRLSSLGWGDAATIIPWTLYGIYQDIDILRISYESMKGWVRFVEKRGRRMRGKKDSPYIITKGYNLGDWLAPDEENITYEEKTPFVSTAYYAHSVDIVAKTATLLGELEDQAYYSDLFERIRKAIFEKYFDDEGRMNQPFQSGYALSIRFNILEERHKMEAASQLARLIKQANNQLRTGFLGTPHLAFALSDYGQEEVAYRLLFEESCPSWLYPISKGATTMWERWDGLLEDGRVNEKKQGKDNMVSFNHYAYGAIGEWLYKRVGGISLLPPTEKGGTFLFWVLCNETIEWAKTSFESVFGKVSCSWRMDKNRWHIEIHIPANTKGMVRIPCVDETLIEGMRVHWEKDESYMQCIIGSGIYRMSYPKKTTKSSCIEEGEITNESISG